MKLIIRNISLLILLALFTNVAGAKDLYLKIIDHSTSEPMQAAYIFYTIQGKKSQAITNQAGISVLKDVSFPLKVEVKYLGYATTTFDLNLSQVKIKRSGYYYTQKIKKENFRMKDMVITGTVTPVLDNQSMYKVNTITQADIQKRGAVSLNDVLQFELNQSVSNDNILGAATSFGGINGQNVKILLNGVPLNGSEAGFIDLNQINMANVKRIETVQGPMSVMYGSNALGGVVNIITEDTKRTIEGNIYTYGESVGRVNVGGAIGMKHKQHNLRISLARNFFQGWSPTDTVERWLLWKPKTQYTTDVNYKYKLKKGVIGYYGYYLGELIENKGVPSVSPYRAFGLDEYYITNRLRNTLSFDYQLSDKEFFTSQNTFSHYKRRKNKYYKNLVTLEQNIIANTEDQDTSIFDQYHFRGAVQSTRFKNSDVQIGYEINHETANSGKIENQRQEMVETGLFGSWTYNYKRFSFMPSARVNLHSKFARNVAYGFYLKYVNKKDLSIRTSLSQGYRSPSMKELYLEFIDNNHMILGNADLKQEQGLHLEVNAEKRLKKGKHNWSIEANVMGNDINNRISYVSLNSQSNSLQYFNVDRFRNLIVSSLVKYESEKLQGSVGVSQTKIIESTGLPSVTFSEVLFHASYLIPRIATRVNVFYKYNNNQPIYFVDGSYAWSNPLHISNLSFSKDLFDKSLTLQAGIKNVFNIQNNIVGQSSSSPISGSPHGGEGNSTLLLPRSVFFNIFYKF